MAAWSRKTIGKNLFFWKNDPLLKIFQNSVSKGFITTPIDVCSNFVKFGRREIGKIVCWWPDKKKFRLAVQLSLPRVSHLKSARTSPRQCTQSAVDFIQIGSLSVELYPNAWTPPERARKCIQYSAEAYSLKPNNNKLADQLANSPCCLPAASKHDSVNPITTEAMGLQWYCDRWRAGSASSRPCSTKCPSMAMYAKFK